MCDEGAPAKQILLQLNAAARSLKQNGYGDNEATGISAGATSSQQIATKDAQCFADDIQFPEPPQSQLETCSSTDGGLSRPGSPRHHEIRRIAAPLSKEQLIEIIATAASISPSVKRLVQVTALASPAARRIMVRNIHYNTSDDQFMSHFAQFGPLEDAAIVREKCGRSKGFGFVTFKEMDSMRECLNSSLHLDGRKLFVKVAADPFSEFLADGAPIQGRMTRRKVFVRNLPVHCETEELKEAFRPFGPIEDCAIVSDSCGRSRGFAFITFQNQESAVKAAAEPQQTFAGRVIFVSIAKSGLRSAAGKSKPNSPRHTQILDPSYLSTPCELRPNVLYEPWTHQSTTESLQDLVDSAARDFSQQRDRFNGYGSASHGRDGRGLHRNDGFAHYACLYPYSAAAAAAAYNLITATPTPPTDFLGTKQSTKSDAIFDQ